MKLEEANEYLGGLYDEWVHSNAPRRKEKAMKLTITINTDNDAFQGDAEETEIARILRDIADRCRREGVSSRKLRDFNGNTCGSLKVTL